MIYVIQAGERGPVKIGHTRDLRVRLSALQTASPHELTVLATCPGDAGMEALLHLRFEACRTRGEWFLIPDQEWDDVTLMMTLFDCILETGGYTWGPDFPEANVWPWRETTA